MQYCEEAIINCDNYGEAILSLRPCYIRREERDDSQNRKKTKRSEFIMKSSVRVCLHRKTSEWKESSESRKSRIVLYSRWNLGFTANQEQFLNGHERQ